MSTKVKWMHGLEEMEGRIWVDSELGLNRIELRLAMRWKRKELRSMSVAKGMVATRSTSRSNALTTCSQQG